MGARIAWNLADFYILARQKNRAVYFQCLEQFLLLRHSSFALENRKRLCVLDSEYFERFSPFRRRAVCFTKLLQERSSLDIIVRCSARHHTDRVMYADKGPPILLRRAHTNPTPVPIHVP
jgi:hypothetical protein